MKLSLEAIQVIDAIARGGSFSAAAELLNKVPSTISYTVAKLEEQLGMSLFLRNGPRVSLTRVGTELLKEGRWLLAAASDLESRLQRIATGYEAELRIVCDAVLPLACLMPVLAEFEELGSATRVRLSTEVMTGVWEALREGRADLIIATGEPPAGDTYHAVAIAELDFAFYISPEHPLARHATPLSRDQLLAHNAIVVADSARALPTRTVGLLSGQRRITVPDPATKLALQCAGLGHGFLPRLWAEPALRKHKLVELEVAHPKTPETLWLAYPSGAAGEGRRWWQENLSRERMGQLLRTIPRWVALG